MTMEVEILNLCKMAVAPKFHSEPEPMVGIFERELEEIKDKEKEEDLKAEQRKFSISILQLGHSNVDALRGFREDHPILRIQLNHLIEEKRERLQNLISKLLLNIDHAISIF
jgi:hypothetical protein